jgi:hypothetical protein
VIPRTPSGIQGYPGVRTLTGIPRTPPGIQGYLGHLQGYRGTQGTLRNTGVQEYPWHPNSSGIQGCNKYQVTQYSVNLQSVVHY